MLFIVFSLLSSFITIFCKQRQFLVKIKINEEMDVAMNAEMILFVMLNVIKSLVKNSNICMGPKIHIKYAMHPQMVKNWIMLLISCAILSSFKVRVFSKT